MSQLELSAAIKSKKISVAESVEEYIKMASTSDAFITVCAEKARLRAKDVQSQIDAGDLSILNSPLAGVPVAVKDNISTLGVKTTCASRMLADYTPVFNATVIDKVEQAGMIVVGKLNMDEFDIDSFASSFATSSYATSSASPRSFAGQVPLALGFDLNASGVISVKPTYGAVSRHGVVASVSSMDSVGVTGVDINDCAALLEIISDKNNQPGQTLKITELDESDLPLNEYVLPTYQILASAEISSNLSRFDGLKYGYRAEADTLLDVYKLSRSESLGLDVKKQIMLGTLVLSSDFYDNYYKKALQARMLIKQAYYKLFADKDTTAISVPASPVVVAALYLTGLPAIAKDGILLIGQAFSDSRLIRGGSSQ